MSENDNNYEYDEQSEEEINNIDCNKTYQKKNEFYDTRNKNLHFLPVKISHTGRCKASVFFNPLIEKKQINKNSTSDDNDYTTSFRGRIFNGKKIEKSNSYNLKYLKTSKRENNYNVISQQNVENFYLWKFDEMVPSNNTLISMNEILNDLKVLK